MIGYKESWSPVIRASTLWMTSSQCHGRHQIKHASSMSPSHALHQLSESEQIPTMKIKKPKLTNTGLSRIIHIFFICMYLHLPSICLLRPLSVPRTLPHPLQIRFQRRHTPRGEKPRKQLGFRAETQAGRPVTVSSDCQSWAFPQHLSSGTIWYRSTKSKLGYFFKKVKTS